MSAHTPGPWLITDSGTFVYALNGRGSNRFWLSVSAAGPDHATQAEREANARLIAAAPELLEALQWYVDNDGTNIGQPGNEPYEAGLNRARAAIAKATGETE